MMWAASPTKYFFLVYIAFYFFTLMHLRPWFIFILFDLFYYLFKCRKAVNIKLSSSSSFFNSPEYFVFFSTASITSIMPKLFFCVIKLNFISVNKKDCTFTDASTSLSCFHLTVVPSHFYDVTAIIFCRCCV